MNFPVCMWLFPFSTSFDLYYKWHASKEEKKINGQLLKWSHLAPGGNWITHSLVLQFVKQQMNTKKIEIKISVCVYKFIIVRRPFIRVRRIQNVLWNGKWQFIWHGLAYIRYIYTYGMCNMRKSRTCDNASTLDRGAERSMYWLFYFLLLFGLSVCKV